VSGSFRRRLLVLTAAGILARLAFAAFEPATYPVADETMWLTWGTRILPSPDVAFSPLRLRFIFHPPLYLYFLGVVFALSGTLGAVKIVQAMVGGLLTPALGLIGRPVLGERPGLVAAAIAAFYPELVWFSAHFWSETLFTVLLWWGFERLLVADADASPRTAAVAGALLGLAVLTRETVLYFLPIAAVWLAWRRAGGGRRAAIVLAMAALVVLPWTVRNALVFHAFVPVSTAGALNLWQGNTHLSRQKVYEEYWSVHGRIEKYRHSRRRAIESILARQPWWLFEKVRDEMPQFWAAHGQPIVHLERGAYGDVPRPVAGAAIAVVLVPYLAVLALFVLGIAVLPLNRGATLLLTFLVFYVLLHVAAHGYPRYRLPALPVLFLGAGSGWAYLHSRSRWRPPRRRLVAAVAVALALVLSVGPSLVSWATRPWPPAWSEAHDDTGPHGTAPGRSPDADEP
jgi:4-amino-4-deoxy-L-arabinose transferase-like glycosyltransferase